MPTTMLATEWLTVPEAAQRLHISRPFAYSLIADGTLPGYRIGRALRVKMSDLDAVVKPVEPKARTAASQE